MDISYLAIFLIVISGTVVFSLRQIILKFFIEPIQKQKEAIGEIADVLFCYCSLCVNFKQKYEPKDSENNEDRKIARKKLKQLRGLLISRTYFIPYYRFFSVLRLVAKKQNTIKS